LEAARQSTAPRGCASAGIQNGLFQPSISCLKDKTKSTKLFSHIAMNLEIHPK